MECILANFNYGNGPFIKTLHLGLQINKERVQRGFEEIPIIVPLVYGNKQLSIMSEEFDKEIKKNPSIFLIDKFIGGLLEDIFYKGDNYQQSLENLLKRQPLAEDRLQDYLSGSFKTQTLSGKTFVLNKEQIFFELSNNPKLLTGCQRSFMTTEGLFSKILYKAVLEPSLDLDISLLNETRIQIANKIEENKNIILLSEPSIFSYESNKKRWREEIFTPPFTHPPKNNTEEISNGMYIMVSGIEGLRKFFDVAKNFNIILYCPPYTNLEGANNSYPPEIVSNPNIKYQFARTGWSTVWWSHMSETPLITFPYQKYDDPEIFFNERTVKKLNLATIYNEGIDNPEDILKIADSKVNNLKYVNSRLLENYGTIDGIEYMSRIICDFLDGTSIESYKNVEQVL